MEDEKPRPSAGLVVAGMIAGLGGLLLRWLSVDTGDSITATTGLFVIAVGLVCIVAGVWRVLSAVDAVVLHRWEMVRAQRESDIDALAARRATLGTPPQPEARAGETGRTGPTTGMPG